MEERSSGDGDSLKSTTIPPKQQLAAAVLLPCFPAMELAEYVDGTNLSASLLRSASPRQSPLVAVMASGAPPFRLPCPAKRTTAVAEGCGGVDASVKYKRFISWNLLKNLPNQSDLPWITMAGFNGIIHPDEKIGNCPCPQWLMEGFNDVAEYSGLRNFEFNGY
nr:endonuclease/exonuclease/phosphatase family protein [Ipomoea batatas]